MGFVDRTLRWQRVTLAVLPAVAALAFWRGAFDVFNTTKATLILLGAIAVCGIGAVRLLRTRVLHVPASPWLWGPVVALLAALLWATVTSAEPLFSVVGRPGRHTGLAMYSAYLALFAVGVRVWRDALPDALVKSLLLVTVPVALYGLLQSADVEPLGWNAVEGGPQVFSTFGNANFMAGFLGVVVPLAVWGAITKRLHPVANVGCVLLALLALYVAVASSSQQGPAAALAGSAFVATVAVVGSGLPRRAKAAVLGAGAAVGTLGLVLLASGVGPFGSVQASLQRSLATRTPKWRAALGMWADAPFTGVGLERYADFFHAYRPAATAAADGLRRTTDTPHNVVLDMLANGGTPLALAYLAFVAVAGYALVVGLRRLRGEDRLLLGGLGGAWLAYQAQSLVSIDVPPIALLHFLLAAAVVAVGLKPALREVRLPGAPVVVTAPRSSGGKRKKTRKTPTLVPAPPFAVTGLVVLGLVLATVAVTPLRADVAARSAALRGASEDGLAGWERAGAIARWESRYHGQLGQVLERADRPEDAYTAYAEALRREPRALGHAMNAARVAHQVGRAEDAERLHDQVEVIDPQTPEVLTFLARYRLSVDQPEEAQDLAARAVQQRGDDPELWVALGQARAAVADANGARAAFLQALELDPDVDGAQEGLTEVGSA